MQWRRLLLGLTLISLFALLFTPLAEAKMYSAFEVSGWIPYWRAATGSAEALIHMDRFKELDPFAYTVKDDGTLVDQALLDRANWTVLQSLAREQSVRYIPSVMWSKGTAIHNVLSNKVRRDAHIQSIVNAVNAGGFDGIDIDYESKLIATKDSFSLFIRDLSKALHNKWIMCTIEPMSEDYNNFDVLNQYCDRVRVMAYDQASVDLHFASLTAQPYVPVADVVWVEKVTLDALKTISKNKLVIGVPTYGYEMQVKQLTNGYAYKLVTAFNQSYALDLAAKLNLTPQRNAAGELSFSYWPTSLGAGSSILWWSDAEAIKAKLDLAKRLGVRGIAIFKIDGGADPNLWNILPTQQ